MTSDYENRIRRVIRHISDNPAGDLSLDALADVAAMSRFHWHRVFRAMTGETCAEAVRRLRMHRAATWIVETDQPIERIASCCGYENVQSFNRLFREIMSMTPEEFRARGTNPQKPAAAAAESLTSFHVELREEADRHLAGLVHRGAYSELGRAFEQMAAIFAARELWPYVQETIVVITDDPNATSEDEITALAGFSVAPDFTTPDDLQETVLSGGRHAVVTHIGPYALLGAAYDWLYGEWLPASGFLPADRPTFEVYRNSPMDTAPAELRTEIFLPLAETTAKAVSVS